MSGKEFQWLTTGHSVQGASHIRRDIPNQDDIGWLPPNRESSPYAIVAISDGHGSAEHFRSDVGSKLAVRAALSQTEVLLDMPLALKNLPKFKHHLEEKFPKQIVSCWLEKVNAHVEKSPFTSEEKNCVLDREGDLSLLKVQKNKVLAYGATLLLVLVAENFIYYLQLGDGDILAVDEFGAVTRVFEEDIQPGDDTPSLCIKDAWKEAKTRLIPRTVEFPELILVSTDGYANSFRNDEDFQKIGTDYLKMIRERGLATTKKELNSILREVSDKGSGDDISLGIIKRFRKDEKDGSISANEEIQDNRKISQNDSISTIVAEKVKAEIAIQWARFEKQAEARFIPKKNESSIQELSDLVSRLEKEIHILKLQTTLIKRVGISLMAVALLAALLAGIFIR